jgi:hypothetical protein
VELERLQMFVDAFRRHGLAQAARAVALVVVGERDGGARYRDARRKCEHRAEAVLHPLYPSLQSVESAPVSARFGGERGN